MFHEDDDQPTDMIAQIKTTATGNSASGMAHSGKVTTVHSSCERLGLKKKKCVGDPKYGHQTLHVAHGRDVRAPLLSFARECGVRGCPLNKRRREGAAVTVPSHSRNQRDQSRCKPQRQFFFLLFLQ